MPPLPVISGDQLARALRKTGYRMDRIRGSHMILAHPDRTTLSVPRHRELDRGLLRRLIRDAGVSPAGLIDLLREV